MGRAVLPAWVRPPFRQVAAVRLEADQDLWNESSLSPVARSLDWVAGLRSEAPLTAFVDAPSMPRVMAERLCAWELLTGRPVADLEYGQLGYMPLAPDKALMDREYAGGVWHALAWLLGEEREPPDVQHRVRRAAG